MSQLDALGHTKPGQVLRWCALIAVSLVLASLVQAIAAAALVDAGAAGPPATRLSATTAALADGDDVRARFLVSIDGEPGRPSAP